VLRTGLILALLVLVLTTVGCGGGGGGSSGSIYDPKSSNYDRQETAIHYAGLEICTKAQATSAGYVGSGLVQSRTFVLAPDCNNAPAVPTSANVLTLTNQQTAKEAEKKAKQQYPKAVLLTYKSPPTVTVVNGPQAKTYAADLQRGIQKTLAKESAAAQTS
jgi:hypothetical protein